MEPGTLSRYATGRIALWVRKGSPIDINQGVQALADARVRKIAIANPEHAPYGRAAVAALQHEKIYDKVRDRFVLGENIAQAAQFVESSNADIGILALSLVLAPPLKSEGRYYEIPTSFYPAIDQAVVILKSSQAERDRPAIPEFPQAPGNRRIHAQQRSDRARIAAQQGKASAVRFRTRRVAHDHQVLRLRSFH